MTIYRVVHSLLPVTRRALFPHRTLQVFRTMAHIHRDSPSLPPLVLPSNAPCRDPIAPLPLAAVSRQAQIRGPTCERNGGPGSAPEVNGLQRRERRERRSQNSKLVSTYEVVAARGASWERGVSGVQERSLEKEGLMRLEVLS